MHNINCERTFELKSISLKSQLVMQISFFNLNAFVYLSNTFFTPFGKISFDYGKTNLNSF